MLKLSSCYVAPAVIHNLTLDKISKLKSFPDFGLEEAYQTGVDTLNEILNPGTEPFEAIPYTNVEPYYSALGNGASSEEFIQMLNDAGLLTPEVKSKLEELNSIIKDRETPEGFDEQINQFIEEIEGGSFNDVEKMMFISAGNVSIASKNYWLAASENESSPWYPALQEDNLTANQSERSALRLPKWLKVIFVAAIDCVGVVAGALLGGLFDPSLAPQGATVVGAGSSAAGVKAFFG